MAAAKHTEDGFRAWLDEFDLQPPTIDGYVSDVRQANEHGGVLKRLRNDELAPKTRRRALAAYRKWAEYTEDPDLTKALKRVRLPPARRQTPKVPLPREQYDLLVDEIGRAKYLTPGMRGVLGLLACRGLRCGDALRLQRHEIATALETGVLSHVAKGRRRLEFPVLKTYVRWLRLLAAQPGTWKHVGQLVSPRAKGKNRRKTEARSVERALVRVGVHCGIYGGLHPHRLRRTYAVEYLRGMIGDPEALIKLQQHMCWASAATCLEYIDHARGSALDDVAERVFGRADA